MDRLSEIALSIREKARKTGADDAECFVRRVQSLNIEVQDGRIDGIRRADETSVALRVLVDGRPGFSFATNPEGDTVTGMVEDAIGAARLVPPGEENLFSTASSPGTSESILDMTGLDLELEAKVQLAIEQEKHGLNADSRVVKIHKPSYAEQYRSTVIASGGEVWSYDDSTYSIGTQAIAEEGGESQSGYEYSVSRKFSDLDAAQVGEKAGLEAARLLGGTSPETGTYRALFPPKTAINIIGVLLASFSADEMQKGRSRLSEKMGEKLFSSGITLVDDGARPWGLGTTPFDDERVVPIPRKLINAGVVNGCMHTLKTAGKWGVEPTGNGFRGSTSSIPMPGSTNLYIEPGPGSVVSALDGERTVQLVNLMGIHTADRVTGDFSVGASGFIVEKDLKKRPFRNGTISGNIFELLSMVIEVGDDLIFYGSTGAPSILVESVVVSGS